MSKEIVPMKLRFVCDQCKKQSWECKDIGFPYADQWKYLYTFKFKTKSDKQIKRADNHFCSTDCMKNYILEVIEKHK